jgi:hypothetical protein
MEVKGKAETKSKVAGMRITTCEGTRMECFWLTEDQDPYALNLTRLSILSDYLINLLEKRYAHKIAYPKQMLSHPAMVCF